MNISRKLKERIEIFIAWGTLFVAVLVAGIAIYYLIKTLILYL